MQKRSQMKKKVSQFTRKCQEMYFSCLEIYLSLEYIKAAVKTGPFCAITRCCSHRNIPTPFRNERDNLLQHFSLMKSSENEFDFFTCILTDYVAHESPKEF